MGRPKEALDFGGLPLLEHLVRRMTTVVEHVVIVAAPDQQLPPLSAQVASAVCVVRDPVPDQGPLLGLLTGWQALPPSVEWIVALAVDAPLVRAEVLRGLLQQLQASDDTCDAVVPRVDGRWHPLLAAYRRRCLAVLQGLYARGVRRLQQLCDTLHVQPLRPEQLRQWDPSLDCLYNINTPQAYLAALARWSLTESRRAAYTPPTFYTGR
jgi:molybdopterin-guanine dinucleotide biosynthesis protein A